MRKCTPAFLHSLPSSSSAASGPLKLTERGLLTAASSTVPSKGRIASIARAAESPSAAMRPRPRVAAWAVLLSWMTLTACSRSKAPLANRGRHLSDAVPEHRVRTKPAPVERFEESDLQREERGLCELGEVQAGLPLSRLQFFDDREPRSLAHQGVNRPHRAPEVTVLGEEAPAHSRPLGTVSGEHESELRGSPGRLPRYEAVTPPFGGERRQASGDLRGVAAECGEAMIVVLPAPCRAAGYLAHRSGVGLEEQIAVACGQLRQRPRASGGEEEGKSPPAALAAGAPPGGRAMLPEHDVGIGAAEPEGIDPQHRRRAAGWYLGVLGHDPEIQVIEGNVGVRRAGNGGRREWRDDATRAPP